MADRLPNSEFLLIPSAGHNPLTEVPQLIAPKIIAFLTSTRNAKESQRKEAANQLRPQSRV
jgi:hypothetical protein